MKQSKSLAFFKLIFFRLSGQLKKDLLGMSFSLIRFPVHRPVYIKTTKYVKKSGVQYQR